MSEHDGGEHVVDCISRSSSVQSPREWQANQKEQELWDLMKVALAGAPKASTSLARAEDVARTLEQARLTQQLRNAKERREALEATAVGEGARVAEDAYVKV